ncbi:FMN adenylyltransferase [Mizugakiibacter sediminis]|uniref:Riboflavin biosynthesis protein n=1 Tax=Mizugakiibacter sediminis TaxID=1475481 RepID=A0A0K8QR64_9GAMM|nr:bifunctional riboflavin kinase/FAD synthetase [Mizugakiibacter sediminis]GAP67403.1 FMN adenylyltransferase [Mizugakiibacter sediminis]
MVKVFRDVAGPCLAPGGSVVAVGAFDGLHRGHRALLARVRERAAARSLVPVTVSFEPLPRQFFARGEPLPRLSSLREKLLGFAEAGIEATLLLRFDAALAAMPAETFVREVLAARLGAREIWVGEDFRFGHRRGGDLAMLQRLGGALGFEAHALPPVSADGERVSASRIRALLAAGEFASAARLLGRPFAIGGRVVRGERLGRKLGYPTANLRLGRRVAPVGGIFAVRVRGIGDAPWPGVASLGVRPTVDGREPLLEAHLFDYDGDLYGRRIEVEFVAKLREEAKFPDLDALKRQMDRDAAEARRLLGGARAAAGART